MSTEPSPGNARLPRFGRGPALGVFLGFLLLGGVYTLPLARHLGEALPFVAVPPGGHEQVWRAQGDYLQLYYYLWLVRDQLLHGRTPLVDPYQFAAYPPRPNLSGTFVPLSLIFVPASVGGLPFAYNALVLLSFPLTGLCAALLARQYGLGRGPAIVAGAVLAFAPSRVGTLLGGHPAGFGYYLFPLALWGLERALAGSVGGGVWAGVALAALAPVDPHFLYFAALGLPVYLLARGGLPGWEPAMLRPGGWAPLLALGVVAAPAWGLLGLLRRQGWPVLPATRLAVGAALALVGIFIWQACAGCLRAAGIVPEARAAARQSLLRFIPWLAAAAGPALGARATAGVLLLPLVLHAWRLVGAIRILRPLALPLGLAGLGVLAGGAFVFLYRKQLLSQAVARAGRPLSEVLLFSPLPEDLLVRVNSSSRAIYPGALALLLAGIGLWSLARRPPSGARRVLLAFGPILALSILLSLGPRFTLLPLYEAGFRLVPYWQFIRQPAKFQVLAGLALAVLAAVGADRLVVAGRRRRVEIPLCALLALGIAAEYHPWRPVGVSGIPHAGHVFDTIRGLGPLALYVPLWPGDSSYSALYLHTTTLTRVPMLNGYSPLVDRRYMLDVYRPIEAVNMGRVGPAEHARLREHRIRQVILDVDAFPLRVNPFGAAFTRRSLESSPFLDLVDTPIEEAQLWVFRVRDAPRSGVPRMERSPLGVYWEAESLARETGRVALDEDASNGRVVEARVERDRAGFITFGPYRLLPAGPFRSTFRVRGEGSGLTLQVTTRGGSTVLGQQAVRLTGPGWEEVTVRFDLDEPALVETRTGWDGAGWAAADAIAIVFADVPDPAPVFEVEELGHALAERRDPEASGGWAGYARPQRAPRDWVWHGPFRRYPTGHYRLLLRLKVDQMTTGSLAWCGAKAAPMGPALGGRDVDGAELPVAGRYAEVAVPFALTRPTVVELSCIYRGTTGVWFDRIRVEGPLGPG